MAKPLGFGENLPSAGSEFLRLKQKGDRVQFKIGQAPVFIAKHFIQTESGWDVPLCAKLMEGIDCERCDKYWGIVSKIKRLQKKDPQQYSEQSPEIKTMRKEAREFQNSIEFYFPILNRETKKFQLLQTTMGVRNKFNDHFKAGIAVLDKEWILMNTGSEAPAGRYALSMVDSADVIPIDAIEKPEFDKAKSYDLTQISNAPSGEEETDEQTEFEEEVNG